MTLKEQIAKGIKTEGFHFLTNTIYINKTNDLITLAELFKPEYYTFNQLEIDAFETIYNHPLINRIRVIEEMSEL